MNSAKRYESMMTAHGIRHCQNRTTPSTKPIQSILKRGSPLEATRGPTGQKRKVHFVDTDSESDDDEEEDTPPPPVVWRRFKKSKREGNEGVTKGPKAQQSLAEAGKPLAPEKERNAPERTESGADDPTKTAPAPPG